MAEFLRSISLETIGLARVREALEANDWDSFTADLSSSADGNIDLHELGLASGDEDDDHDRDFSVEVAEPESSMSQMRTAILDPSNEDTEEDTKDQRQERPEEEEVYGEGIGHVTSGMRDGNGNATSDEDQKMQEEAESEDEDIQVGELESMMLKMQAIKGPFSLVASPLLSPSPPPSSSALCHEQRLPPFPSHLSHVFSRQEQATHPSSQDKISQSKPR